MAIIFLGLAGLAHAVDTEPEPVLASSLVCESSTWEQGYDLIDGIDDYGYAVTPNEEVAGETPVRFEQWALREQP